VSRVANELPILDTRTLHEQASRAVRDFSLARTSEVLERRMREEVVDDPSALLGPDEWAYYEDEDEVSVVRQLPNAFRVQPVVQIVQLRRWEEARSARLSQERKFGSWR
jgi:hypothetical protein